MGVLLGESHDDVPEVGQGLVDVLGLSQSHPLAPAVFDSLTASKINLKCVFHFQFVCHVENMLEVRPNENFYEKTYQV